MRKLAIEHRWARRPSVSLTSPKTTEHKIRAEGQCRMCERPWAVRAPTRHHIIPDSWFLRQPAHLRVVRNAHANIVPLCRACHDLVDKSDDEEVREGARRMLRRSFSQSEIAFIYQVRGRDWLDQNYPEH